jgi:hypothetical protein
MKFKSLLSAPPWPSAAVGELTLPPIMEDQVTVFTHRGLPPLQFTPMSGAHKITAANAGWPLQFRIRGSRHWPGVAEFYRWAF